MPITKSQRLRIPSHYYVYSDPPDKSGDEVLHFISAQRRVRLKGHSFREFVQRVVPLLDGRLSVEEVHAKVSDLFEPDDLATCLDLLNEHGVLEDVSEWPIDEAAEQRLRPQLNFFHDLALQPWEIQHRLKNARIAVVGLTGAGVAATQSLSAAGVGTVRCLDDTVVGPADVYFNATFTDQDIGRPRVEAACVDPRAPVTIEELSDDPPDFIINALDEGNLSLAYKLNRSCLATKTPWISTEAAGFEVIIGPTVYPGETACFACYRMRLVACEDDPQVGFDRESYLDRRRSDDSAHRANLVSGAAIAGQLAATEILKAITGISKPATRSRIIVFDLRDFSSATHVVLRKPWCPVCGNSAAFGASV
jgi:bacteriocin biosynthesis cyclodehydratase domain-containing protein